MVYCKDCGKVHPGSLELCICDRPTDVFEAVVLKAKKAIRGDDVYYDVTERVFLKAMLRRILGKTKKHKNDLDEHKTE